ncbi:MAG: hypothetical protein ABJO27_00260 [Pseudoruegeria sp.]
MVQEPNAPQQSAISKFVALMFSTLFTILGLMIASHAFFEFPVLEEFLKVTDQNTDKVAMFGMLIFGVGFALLLTQFFAEAYSVAWKGVTFAGTLAAILIFIWIARLVILESDQTTQIQELNDKIVNLTQDLTVSRERNRSFTTSFRSPRDLSLNINCPRGQRANNIEVGQRIQLLAISSGNSPRERNRISEILERSSELESDVDIDRRSLLTSEVMQATFHQVRDADLLFRPKLSGGGISFFVPGLLSYPSPDVEIRLINADPADSVSNPSYSDMLSIEIGNSGDLDGGNQHIVADLQFAALAEFCDLES